MTKLYLFFVFFVSAVSLMAGPNTYTLINDKTYTWLEAKADAESRGGYLVTITTIDEENKLKKLFPSMVSSVDISWAIGATTKNGGSWITGEFSHYMPWRSGYGPGQYSGNHKYGEWHGGGMRNMENHHVYNGYILEKEHITINTPTTYKLKKLIPPGFSMLSIPFSHHQNTVNDIFGASPDFVIYEYTFTKNFFEGEWVINAYDSDFEEWDNPSHFLPAGTAVWVLNNSFHVKMIEFTGRTPKNWKKSIELLIP